MQGSMRFLCLLLGCFAGAVAVAAPPSFADLARHPRYSQVQVSADGRYIAATAVVQDHTVLSVISLADGKGFNLETHDLGDIVDFWWVSPTRIIYTEGVRDSDFDEPLANGEIYGVNADGSGRTLLYGYGSANPYWGAAQQLVSTLPGDPEHVLVSVASEDAATADGVVPVVEKMDVMTGRMTKVVAAPARNLDFVADSAGNIRFAYGVDNDDHPVVYRRPPTGGAWVEMPKAEAARDFPIAFDATDKVAWFSCKVPAGFGICGWNPTTREMTPLWINPRVEADGLAQAPVRDGVLGVEFEDGRPGVSLFDPQSPGAKLLVSLMQQFPGEAVRFVSATRDGSRAIVMVASDTDPGTYYLYTRATGKLAPLLRVAAWIDPARMAFKQPFEFKARDGLALQGYISYPPGMENAKRLPMVVDVHGGPYGIRDRWGYDPDVQAIATRGYVVLQVNFRGSGGYGYDFEKAGWKQWGAKMQDDVTDATRWAIAQGIADPNRICIYGASYGGYAALEGAIREPDLYKCTVGYVGVYDLALLSRRGDIQDSTYGKHYLQRVLGDDGAVLAQRSPVNQADKLRARVMLIVGGEDSRVPPIHATDMRAALRKAGKNPVWVYQRKEGHGFYKEANVADLYARIDAFIAGSIGAGALTAPVAPAPKAASAQ